MFVIAAFTCLIARDAPTQEVSCGAASLAVYLRTLSSAEIDLDELRRRLPVVSGGNSMAEVVSTAAHFGLDLAPVSLKGSDIFSRDAGIGYFERRGRGHFAFLRRLDAGGRYVQLVDAPWYPEIVPFEELHQRGFSGLILSRRDSRPLARVAIAISAVVTGLLLVSKWRRRRTGE